MTIWLNYDLYQDGFWILFLALNVKYQSNKLSLYRRLPPTAAAALIVVQKIILDIFETDRQTPQRTQVQVQDMSVTDELPGRAAGRRRARLILPPSLATSIVIARHF